MVVIREEEESKKNRNIKEIQIVRSDIYGIM